MDADNDRSVVSLNWTDDQWNTVLKAVSDEAQRARVAASFLPIWGPVDAATIGVPAFGLTDENAPNGGSYGIPTKRLTVDSFPNLHILRVSMLVYLRSHEIADSNLTAALTQFRRAANVIARVEDTILFNGYKDNAAGTPQLPTALSPLVSVTATTQLSQGLLPWPLPAAPRRPLAAGARAPKVDGRPTVHFQRLATLGNDLITNIVKAIEELETDGHFGPFACTLATDLYAATCEPIPGTGVLPRDRILPFLDGQLFRSGTLPSGFGVVVSLGGAQVELLVASDIRVRLLQASLEPRWVFRASERIALRIKDQGAIAIVHAH